MSSRIYKDRGIVQPSSSDPAETEKIEVQTSAPDVPLAHVEYASQMTLNLGNFESVQCRVGVTLPTPLEELNDAYQAAQQFVENRLTREMDQIRDYRAKRDEEKSA